MPHPRQVGKARGQLSGPPPRRCQVVGRPVAFAIRERARSIAALHRDAELLQDRAFVLYRANKIGALHAQVLGNCRSDENRGVHAEHDAKGQREGEIV